MILVKERRSNHKYFSVAKNVFIDRKGNILHKRTNTPLIVWLATSLLYSTFLEFTIIHGD